MDHTPRGRFEEKLDELTNEVVSMASQCDSMFASAVSSLAESDNAMAVDVIRLDDVIDKLDIKIEGECLATLALEQPLGSDLRKVGTILKIITDLERIADLSVDVAKIGIRVRKEMGSAEIIDIPPMAEFAHDMLRMSIQAFATASIEELPQIAALEDKVDEAHGRLRHQIHDFMRASPDQDVSASWLLLAIHHVERIADHCLNIADRVNFMVTGHLQEVSHSHLAGDFDH
jgi:phosphate transport system protein